MVTRILKRIFLFSSVACLVLACIPSASFAIDPVSGAAALAGALDAYGMAYGVGTVYDVSSSSGVSSSFEGLWDDFSEYQSNAGSQFDYDSFIDDYNQNRSLYGFEHSSGKFAAWSIDAESAEIFDQFWNWLLTGPAEMTRVDNEYFQFSQEQIGDNATPLVVSSFFGPWGNQPIPIFSSTPTISDTSSLLLFMDSSGNGQNNRYAWVSSNITCYLFSVVSSNIYRFYVCSSVMNDTVNIGRSYNGILYSDSIVPASDFDSTTSLYYRSTGVSKSDPVSVPVPVFDTLEEGLSAVASVISDGLPSDSVGVKAYGNGYVTVPDPTLPDYVPTPIEIVTNVPWDSTYDDTDEEDGSPVPYPPVDVPLVVDDILTSISAEDYALEEDPQDPDPDDPPPAPSEVFVPLLPVGLPSFNFSFSGIWHYVREWVSSLGAWFSTLFTIWGALPYAMVVPVYATAVVVIVLGVYKRFFM